MRFEKAFDVSGTPEQVIELFNDLPLMARFLPGAGVGDPNPDGSRPATLTVAFGPKRIAFKGRLQNEIDPANLCGRVSGAASSDARGAKMSAKMSYQLAPAPAGTHVSLVSEAELTGMLADFARTGGVVLADALITTFATAFSEYVAGLQAKEPAAPPPQAAVLSPLALLIQIIKSIFGINRWSRR